MKLLIILLLLCGCSVNRYLEVNIEGKGVKSPYGLMEEGKITLKKITQIGGKK